MFIPLKGCYNKFRPMFLPNVRLAAASTRSTSNNKYSGCGDKSRFSLEKFKSAKMTLRSFVDDDMKLTCIPQGIYYGVKRPSGRQFSGGLGGSLHLI